MNKRRIIDIEISRCITEPRYYMEVISKSIAILLILSLVACGKEGNKDLTITPEPLPSDATAQLILGYFQEGDNMAFNTEDCFRSDISGAGVNNNEPVRLKDTNGLTNNVVIDKVAQLIRQNVLLEGVLPDGSIKIPLDLSPENCHVISDLKSDGKIQKVYFALDPKGFQEKIEEAIESEGMPLEGRKVISINHVGTFGYKIDNNTFESAPKVSGENVGLVFSGVVGTGDVPLDQLAFFPERTDGGYYLGIFTQDGKAEDKLNHDEVEEADYYISDGV